MVSSSVLVVDDEQKVRNLIRKALECDGFSVIEAATEAEAVETITTSDVSLITLDLSLRHGDGLNVARRVRDVSEVPIIMVTGKDDVIDRVVGLELGADDYITKPFHIREFLARVRSVLRRSAAKERPEASTGSVAHRRRGTIVSFDGLSVNLDTFELTGREELRHALTSGEFNLLSVFLTHPKRVLSRELLMDLVCGREQAPLDRTIDNRVARLRKIIERDPTRPQLIKTIRGVGYIFVGNVHEGHDQ